MKKTILMKTTKLIPALLVGTVFITGFVYAGDKWGNENRAPH